MVIFIILKKCNDQKSRRNSISELKGSSGKATSDRISSNNRILPMRENVNDNIQEYAKYIDKIKLINPRILGK